MLANGGWDLTLILLTWTIWRAPTNASKWRMGLNSAFKGLNTQLSSDHLKDVTSAESIYVRIRSYLCLTKISDVERAVALH